MKVVSRSCLLDLSSFQEENLERILPWKVPLFELLRSWNGYFFFSDPCVRSQKKVLGLLSTEGISEADILEHLADLKVDQGKVDFCVSFRLLDKGDIVERPSCFRLYWALGGLDSSDWKDQWDRLLNLGVDFILSESLPEELPDSFDFDDIRSFVNRFVFLPPSYVRGGEEKKKSNFGTITYWETALSPECRVFAECIWLGAVEGSKEGSVLLLDQPQLIESSCTALDRARNESIVKLPFATFLSPFRWPFLGVNVCLSLDSIIEVKSLRSKIEALDSGSFLLNRATMNEERKAWFFDQEERFGEVEFVRDFYLKSERETNRILEYVFRGSKAPKKNECWRWAYSPFFQGALLRLVREKGLDQFLGYMPDETRAIFLTSVLCWAVAIEEETAIEAIILELGEIESVSAFSRIGKIVWAIVSSGLLDEEVVLKIIERLFAVEFPNRILGRTSEEFPFITGVVSIFREGPNDWNYANCNYLVALAYTGKRDVAKRHLKRLAMAMPSLVGYRTGVMTNVLQPLRSALLRIEDRVNYAEIIDFAKWGFETEWTSGNDNNITSLEIAWLWGVLGDVVGFENILKDRLPEIEETSFRIRFSVMCWWGSGDHSIYSKWIIDSKEITSPLDRLAVALLAVLQGNYKYLEDLAKEGGVSEAFGHGEELWELFVPRALLLFALNAFCGCEEAAQRIRCCVEDVRPDLIPYLERVEWDCEERDCVAPREVIGWQEALNATCLDEALVALRR